MRAEKKDITNIDEMITLMRFGQKIFQRINGSNFYTEFPIKQIMESKMQDLSNKISHKELFYIRERFQY